MKRLLLAAIATMAASGPAWAQSSMTRGTGIGVAGSTSSSQAVSGQGGTGSASRRSPPTAPCQPIRRSRTCRALLHRAWPRPGSKRASGRFPAVARLSGPDFSFGTTIPDPGCAARLDARTLWSFGLKKAAVARLCLNPEINRAMPEVCVKYLPPPAPGYPAPPPVPTRYARAEASEEQPYTGGDIWLVEGATGKNRLCNDYDVTQQLCRVWAHTVHHSVPKKKATASWAHTVPHSAQKKAAASGETSQTAASPAPAPAVAETEKKEKSQVERIERVDLRHEDLLPSLSLYNHHCSSLPLPLLPLLGPCVRTVFATTTM